MEQLTEEEKYLLLGKVTATLSAEEEAQADRLLQEHPQGKAAYMQLCQALPRTADGQPISVKAPRDWPNLGDLLLQQQYQATRVMQRSGQRRLWLAAASLALIAAAAFLVYNIIKERQVILNPSIAGNKPAIELKLSSGETIDLSSRQGTIRSGGNLFNNQDRALSFQQSQEPAVPGRIDTSTLLVPIGLNYQVLLPDGSKVWLNSASKLEFPMAFNGKKREIRITGEAYLQIAKKADQPFVVHLPQSRVEVAGTEFNVNTYQANAEQVALASGAVHVISPAGGANLKPGQQITYRPGEPMNPEPYNSRDVLSWRKGLYYFHEASLEEISQVVHRWYGITVSIDDPAILSRRFSGVIDRNQPIDVFMEDLKAISKIPSHVDKVGTLHIGK